MEDQGLLMTFRDELVLPLTDLAGPGLCALHELSSVSLSIFEDPNNRLEGQSSWVVEGRGG